MENPTDKWYKIAWEIATMFFYWLFKSNIKLFWEIDWINKPRYINVLKAQDILKKYFEQEWYIINCKRESKPEKYEGFIKNNSLISQEVIPDFEQMINIRDIINKKRILIADEIWLWKSTSVILSKELQWDKCKHALLILPSNKIKSWQALLSDKVDKNGNQEWLFNRWMAPQVWIISQRHNFSGLSNCSYVIVSHERFNHWFVPYIQDDYDMVVVDEIHKLKNKKLIGLWKGGKSQLLLQLSQSLTNKDNGSLCMLSWTPIPNQIWDVADILKLLYPERDFVNLSNKQLTEKLINWDIEDIHNLLFTMVQKKESNLQMPKKINIYMKLSWE